MAEFRLGNKDEARRWHAKATAWLDKYPDHDEFLRRAREDAEALLAQGR